MMPRGHPRKPEHFGRYAALVFAHRDWRPRLSGHLALQLLEAPASFAFAIVDKLDRSVPVNGPVTSGA